MEAPIKKPPRTRTAYQVAIVREIRRFCPPKRKPGERKLSNAQQAAFLLPPYETVLMPDGTVVLIWFAVRLKTGNGFRDPPENWLDYSRIDETRAANTAFGIFLDWLDERGLVYESLGNGKLPNIQYRRGIQSGKHFRVTVPRQGP